MLGTMENGGTRELFADAASRGSDYIDGLPGRDVGPLPGSIEV
jgi:hypothetical protein